MFISIIEKNLNLSKKEDFIKKYELEYIGKCKEYSILNTLIKSKDTYLEFYKIVNINDKEYELIKILPFSFYDVQNEQIYETYKKDNIILKSYKNYFNIELINK